MSIPLWNAERLAEHLQQSEGPCALAMYSSEWEAIVTDPACMRIRVDDHLVHRGDGVFETLLCEGGALYNLEAHLQRLFRSAETLGLQVQHSADTLRTILVETFRVTGLDRSLGRVLLGRGPGGFGVDPAQSACTSLTVVVYEAPLPFMAAHPEGARAIISSIPPKSGGLAGVKTCNYIPNALMKAEANRAGVHFAFGLDAEGYLSESFTENIALIDSEGRLVTPPAFHHLAGTTLERVKALAVDEGRESIERQVKPEDLFGMREVWLCGTTAYVTKVVELDSRPLPTGSLAAEFHQLLQHDIAFNSRVRTPVL